MFCNLIMEMTFPHRYHILLVRSNFFKGRGLQGPEHQWVSLELFWGLPSAARVGRENVGRDNVGGTDSIYWGG